MSEFITAVAAAMMSRVPELDALRPKFPATGSNGTPPPEYVSGTDELKFKRYEKQPTAKMLKRERKGKRYKY